MPYLWIKNRFTDSGAPEPNDVLVPVLARSAFMASGMIGIALALFMFISPQTLGVDTAYRAGAGWLVRFVGSRGTVRQPGPALERLASAAVKHHAMGHPDPGRGIDHFPGRDGTY